MRLLPCPFCGCKAYLDNWLDPQFKKTRYFVLCYAGCHANGPMKETEQEAEDIWNGYAKQVSINMALEAAWEKEKSASSQIATSTTEHIGAYGEEASSLGTPT